MSYDMKLPAHGELGQSTLTRGAARRRLRVGMSLKHTMANKGVLVEEEIRGHLRLEAVVKRWDLFPKCSGNPLKGLRGMELSDFSKLIIK